MPETFVVTAAMLRHIATKAMGLENEHRQANVAATINSLYVCINGEWAISATDRSLVVHGFWFDFNDDPDIAAWDLLGWLVRERGWVPLMIRAAGADYQAVCKVENTDGTLVGGTRATTLCEAVLRAILAASGWEEAP